MPWNLKDIISGLFWKKFGMDARKYNARVNKGWSLTRDIEIAAKGPVVFSKCGTRPPANSPVFFLL